MSTIADLAAGQGFDCQGSCNAKDLTTRAEVRAMCAADKCQAYGHSWACPPACGEIDEFERTMHEYDECLVVQTVAQLEDDFDIEAMMEAEAVHKKRVDGLAAAIAREGLGANTLVLSAGTCKLCEACTYPDAPCRFPDKRLVSMEAAGLVVSEVCDLAHIPYNHGPHTLAYSSCVLSR